MVCCSNHSKAVICTPWPNMHEYNHGLHGVTIALSWSNRQNQGVLCKRWFSCACVRALRNNGETQAIADQNSDFYRQLQSCSITHQETTAICKLASGRALRVLPLPPRYKAPISQYLTVPAKQGRWSLADLLHAASISHCPIHHPNNHVLME